MTLKLLRFIAAGLAILCVLVLVLSLVVRHTASGVRASLREQQHVLREAFMHVHARSLAEQLRTEDAPHPLAEGLYQALSKCNFESAYDASRPLLKWSDAYVFLLAFGYHSDERELTPRNPDAPRPPPKEWGVREAEFVKVVEQRMKARPHGYYDGFLDQPKPKPGEFRWIQFTDEEQARHIEQASLVVACEAQAAER